MAATDTVRSLYDAGRYFELVQGVGLSLNTTQLRRHDEAFAIAHALIETGHTKLPEQLAAELKPLATSPLDKSRCDLLLAFIARQRGLVHQSVGYLQSALQSAKSSGDAANIGWIHVHLLRWTAELGPAHRAMALLPQARRAVTIAADPRLTAYLHDSVALMEGQAGRLIEAKRHLNIARTLLERHPNAWIRRLLEINSFCVAYLSCEFEAASKFAADSREWMRISGGDCQLQTINNNQGHSLLANGRFDEARVLLESAASGTNVLSGLGALDGLAKLCLAEGRLDECEATLNRLDRLVNEHQLTRTFAGLWSHVTRAQLALRRGNASHAHAIASKAMDDIGSNNPHLTIALQIVDAQACGALGNAQAASRAIASASELGAYECRDHQPAMYRCLSTLADEGRVKRLYIEQAHLLWKAQKDHRSLAEIGASGELHPDVHVDLSTVLSPDLSMSLAAGILDCGFDPYLLGLQLRALINRLGCSPVVELVESPAGSARQTVDGIRCSLDLGTVGTRALRILCDIPENVAGASTLSDVLRMGRAALAIHQQREQERNRAALWPADAVDEQDDVLFLSEEMQALLAIARRIGPTPVPVLITGETGTGKEVLARTVHACSSRPKGMFLPFNCTSTPRDMLDSQLFGHRRGSFTGATEHFLGVIRTANGGSLFLDEIGDMHPDVQPKLLRFLESNEVHPVGEAHPLRVDVRLIAATNADLDALVAQGRFREDLFYRLNVVRLHLPPLRERRVEIPTFAAHYLRKFAQECAKGDLRLAEETMEYLVLYRWPGNVRQLANEMRRLAALAEPGAVLMPEHLATEITASRRTVPASQRTLDPNEVVVRLDQPLAAAVQHLERAMLLYALKQTNGRIEDAAQRLGLSRKGLYLKRQRFGIHPPEGSGIIEVA